MTMQTDRHDITLLQEQVRALSALVRPITEGTNGVNTTAFSGILDMLHGGTGSKYGPLLVDVMMTNNSGGDLNDGQVVIFDTSGARRCNLTTTVANIKVAGAVKGAGPFTNGNDAPVLILGFHPNLQVQGAVTAGHYLRTSATSGRAEDAGTTPDAGCFALAFSSVGGTGTVAAFVFPAVLLSASSNILTTKGDLMTHSATVTERKGVSGINKRVITEDSAQPDGWDWEDIATALSSVLNTKGDILGYSTLPVRVPISGVNGRVATEDSTQAAGWSWQPPAIGSVQFEEIIPLGRGLYSLSLP